MKRPNKIVALHKEEILGDRTRRDLEYTLDIIQRTLSIMRKGPLDESMSELSIFRLESVEEKLTNRLRTGEK